MFRENTVVVLGAGSSFEAGLPLGAALAKTLSNDLNLSWKSGNQLVRGSPRLSYALLKHPNYRSKGQEWIAAARMISGGVQDAESIDRFVDIHNEHPDVQSIAKLGIVCALLDAEKSSRIFLFEKNTRSWKINPHAIDANKKTARDTWYQTFFEIASDGINVRELDSLFKNIKVISFNYDRTLELFLFEKIKTLYSVSSNTAAKIARQLEIVRPYGWLGPLPIVHESP